MTVYRDITEKLGLEFKLARAEPAKFDEEKRAAFAEEELKKDQEGEGKKGGVTQAKFCGHRHLREARHRGALAHMVVAIPARADRRNPRRERAAGGGLGGGSLDGAADSDGPRAALRSLVQRVLGTVERKGGDDEPRDLLERVAREGDADNVEVFGATVHAEVDFTCRAHCGLVLVH